MNAHETMAVYIDDDADGDRSTQPPPVDVRQTDHLTKLLFVASESCLAIATALAVLAQHSDEWRRASRIDRQTVYGARSKAHRPARAAASPLLAAHDEARRRGLLTEYLGCLAADVTTSAVGHELALLEAQRCGEGVLEEVARQRGDRWSDTARALRALAEELQS